MEGHVALGELTDTLTCGVSLIAASDDAEVRALMRRSVIPGAVRVAFTREPSYFAGEGLAGGRDVTVVARHDGCVVGVGRCSVHTLYRNGEQQRVGYLSELRLADGVPRGVRLLREGYEVLADALADESVDAFFTSVTADNVRARTVLERGGRLGIPRYEPLAQLVTLVAPVRQSWGAEWRGVRRADDFEGTRHATRYSTSCERCGSHTGNAPDDGSVRSDGSQDSESEQDEGSRANGRTAADETHVEYVAHKVDDARCTRDELTDFLDAHSRASHLGLTWTAERWNALAAHGSTSDDIVVVRRGVHIIGAAAVWDQRAFRQVVIDGYEGALRVTRPLVNVIQSLRRLPALPTPGSTLAQGAVLGASVAQPDVWPSLWRALEARAQAKGLSWLSISRDSRDLELPLLQRLFSARVYRTNLYDVALGHRQAHPSPWDARLVRPEVGIL